MSEASKDGETQSESPQKLTGHWIFAVLYVRPFLGVPPFLCHSTQLGADWRRFQWGSPLVGAAGWSSKSSQQSQLHSWRRSNRSLMTRPTDPLPFLLVPFLCLFVLARWTVPPSPSLLQALSSLEASSDHIGACVCRFCLPFFVQGAVPGDVIPKQLMRELPLGIAASFLFLFLLSDLCQGCFLIVLEWACSAFFVRPVRRCCPLMSA